MDQSREPRDVEPRLARDQVGIRFFRQEGSLEENQALP
jgi:hypothetical protein